MQAARSGVPLSPPSATPKINVARTSRREILQLPAQAVADAAGATDAAIGSTTASESSSTLSSVVQCLSISSIGSNSNAHRRTLRIA